MSAWNDFNDAEHQQSFDLIPKGTVAPVRLAITPGGYNDPAQGWEGGWATQSEETGAVYLACIFTITDGKFAKRKVWSNIGLYSPKGPTWGGMGRTFVRAILNSARNIDPNDMSPEAAARRCIEGLHELEGIEFVARIDVERDGNGDLKNVIKHAVEPGMPEYAPLPAPAPGAPRPAQAPRPAAKAGAQTRPGQANKAPVTAKPAWAQ